MKPYFETDNGKLFNGDALKVLSGMESESVQCCITSPPYWGLRDYGVAGQLGLEKTPELYVSKMVEIFREVRRALKPDGTLWLNLGDSYAGSWGDSGHRPERTGSAGTQREKNSEWFKRQGHAGSLKAQAGLKPKDLVGIPWRVAFALQSDGWYLRQDIIWHKPNPMPESVTDRCTKSHEYIFLMSKSAKYYYDNEAIKEPVAESTIGRGKVDFGGAKGRTYKENIKPDDPNFRHGSEQWGRTFDYTKSCINGRNKRSVWTITTKPYKEAHFATFPEALILPCILAGTAENQTILEIFAGSGTVWKVCEKYNRKSINIELSEEYCKLTKKRIINETRQLKLFV